MSEQQPVDDVSLPASLGLSPMALSLQTGSATATPDRLIVAVRHAEVQAQQMFSTLSPPSQGLLSRQKARPIGMTARTTGPSCNALQPSKYEVSQCTLARMRISDAKCARWLQKNLDKALNVASKTCPGCMPCLGTRHDLFRLLAAGHLLAGRVPVRHPPRGLPQRRPQGHAGRAAQDPGEQGERGDGLPAVHRGLLRPPARQHRVHPRPQVRSWGCQATCNPTRSPKAGNPLIYQWKRLLDSPPCTASNLRSCASCPSAVPCQWHRCHATWTDQVSLICFLHCTCLGMCCEAAEAA